MLKGRITERGTLLVFKQTKSTRQEFLESVRNDTTSSLAKRLVKIIRSVQRKERLMAKGLPTFGCLSIQCQHLEIIRKEILRRTKENKANRISASLKPD